MMVLSRSSSGSSLIPRGNRAIKNNFSCEFCAAPPRREPASGNVFPLAVVGVEHDEPTATGGKQMTGTIRNHRPVRQPPTGRIRQIPCGTTCSRTRELSPRSTARTAGTLLSSSRSGHRRSRRPSEPGSTSTSPPRSTNSSRNSSRTGTSRFPRPTSITDRWRRKATGESHSPSSATRRARRPSSSPSPTTSKTADRSSRRRSSRSSY